MGTATAAATPCRSGAGATDGALHALPPQPASREFAFTDREFDRLRALVLAHTGISLSGGKRELVYGRLARRLRALGLSRFRDYCDLIADGRSDELEQFVNAVTTNLTGFFREPHHFDYLAQRALPWLLQQNRRTRRLRIWSAGCATGEEAYSIAITLKEASPGFEGWDVRVLATDLDSRVLETARLGVYARERVQALPGARRERWFLRGRGSRRDVVRVRPELKALVRFKKLNLMDPWPMRGPFDVIFCRNVAIYFAKETRRVLFDRYADLTAAGGYLFVGHSESLFRVTDRFHPLGRTVYRKAT